MTFAFDEQFAMFDITPVENQFILEYLPGAKGDYIKVYLYGLFCCYHPEQGMSIANMSRDLNMTEDEILLAYRYWERRGVVHRVQDHPPAWQYVNIKQKSISGDTEPDPEYIQFRRELENCFDGIRDFHGSETATFFEWKESLGLPAEVIIMLLMHMKNTRGKSFRIKDAEKVAIQLADEKAFTIEEAELVLARDQAMNSGFRKVLRKLGMRFTPSDANLNLYRKWTEEWHFTQEAIEDACDRTETSSPSLALVDKILEKTYQTMSDGKRTLDKSAVEAYGRQRNGLKEVLSEAGLHGTATPAQQKLYDQMSVLYPQKIILLAAGECAAKQKSLDSVMKLLQSWKDRGFTTENEIREHIEAFHEKEEFLSKIRQYWSSKNAEPGQMALQMLEKWESELGFSREMITIAAELAFEAKKPVSYMDKTLREWAENGIRTPEDLRIKQNRSVKADFEKERKNKNRSVTAQQYTQRDYANEQNEAMQRMLNMNGGE